MSTELRPELEALPAKMAHLPVYRGYPVPWFVEWFSGVPDFRQIRTAARLAAVQQHRCWVCGGKIAGRFGYAETFAFVVGPMCALNRISAEPPSHHICASWSARN